MNLRLAKIQLRRIKRATVEIIQEEELLKKLKQGRPLIVKAGFDPSCPDIHLGHSVLLRKLRLFQELGHKVIFLIGDFTAMIGDPTGRSQMRKPLGRQEVLKNAQTYEQQISKILDVKKAQVRFNSEWLGMMNLTQLINLASKQTVARMLERDDFSQRFRNNQDITILEFLYPLLQAYDSVVLKADIEVGGTDQKFNMLMGRTIQKRFGQEPQVIITMPLLVGIDGIEKMSKSTGNYIGINESPTEMFGKLMSISDELMLNYYELLTDVDLGELKENLSLNKLHPKDAKLELAKSIVATYWGQRKAKEALGEFQKVFKEKKIPSNIPAYSFPGNDIGILDAMIASNLAKTRNEARRLINQGAVRLNGHKVTDSNFRIILNKSSGLVLKVGKRGFARISRG
jgi:tyrosyl-tRNA synthetase